MPNGSQFDPVAGAALGALDAVENSLNRVQSRQNAPQLPAQANVLSTLRNGIETVAEFSPVAILARGRTPSNLPDLPSLPGMRGQNAFDLPDLPDFMSSSSGGGGGGGGGASSASSGRRRSGGAFGSGTQQTSSGNAFD